MSESGPSGHTAPPSAASAPTDDHPIDIGTVEPPAFASSASSSASDPSAAASASTSSTDGEPAPRRRLPARRIVLGALVVVALAGGVAFGRTGWQIYTQKDATLDTPAKIGNLTLDDSTEGMATAEYLQTALSAEVKLDKAVGAVYRDSANKNILFLGGTGLFWTPADDLSTAFGLIADNEGAVTGLHDVDAGPLGGTMKCGATKTDEGDLTVCGWADHGSLAMAMFPSSTDAEAAPLMRDIRAAAQKR